MKKYGLLKYNKTNNIGDEIQSIAAKQFLPHVDVFVDREKLSDYKGDKIKLILNGWFMNNPKKFPPSKDIEPLFISFHITKESSKILTSENSIKYLKKYEPIGCRDYYTLELLKKKGIKSYFSGCLTLTLKPKGLKKRESILFVDINEKIIEKIKNSFEGNFKYISHATQQKKFSFLTKYLYQFKIIKKIRKLNLVEEIIKKVLRKKENYQEKFNRAEKLLEEYERAKLVITTRIHVALPCLAIGTPVIFIVKDKEDPRFEGIMDLFNCYESNIFIDKNFKIKWKDIKENPEKHLKLKKELEKRCKEFING